MMNTDNFKFIFQKALQNQVTTLTLPYEEALSFIFVTKGSVQVKIFREEQTIHCGEYLFFYLQSDNDVLLNIAENTEYTIFHTRPDILFHRISKVCCYIERIQDSVEQKESCFLLDVPFKINPYELRMIDELEIKLNKSEVPNFYIDGYGFNLLALHLEYQELLKAECIHMKREDIAKMHQARNLIEQNVQNALSIAELARAVGTNQAYLKQHFKDTFGLTVFGYTLQYKMEYSKILLKEGQLTISDIAYQVGYKHATHFTQAFKKYFGCLPNSVKRAICFFWSFDSLSYIPLTF